MTPNWFRFGPRFFSNISTMKSLSEFLLTNRQHYLEALNAGKTKDWTVVVGNESGDLDSTASSIAYSFLASTLLNKPTVALLRTARSDFQLRAENDYALSLAKLKSDHSDLLCIDDIPSTLFSEVLRSSFALVDHNCLDRIFTPTSETSPEVVAIIDHHNDEGCHKTAQLRTIVVPVGSCTSLITKHFLSHWQRSTDIPSDVATLLLTGILIDTHGLRENGKAVRIDHEAFQFLLPRSNLKEPLNLVDEARVDDIVRNLESLKSSVSHLSSRDLLRRDYKEYSITSQADSRRVVGIASVPLNFKTWLEMHPSPKFWGVMDDWMKERHLDVLAVLLSFRSKKRNKHKRQMLCIVRSGLDDLRKGLFKGLEDHKTGLDLEVKPLKTSYLEGVETTKSGNVKTKAGGRARLWKQRNAEATRKIIAPVVKSIVESL